MRALIAAAIGSGQLETAEALMRQWRALQRFEENLTRVEAELAALRDEVAVETADSTEGAQEPESASQTPVATTPDTASSGTESRGGEGFVSPDRAVLEVPESTPAGAVIRFAWRGPSAPGDLLFIATQDMAENRYYISGKKRHETSAGTPAIFVAPAQEGEYELRYFSYQNGGVLTRQPLKVSAAEIRFSTPESVNPGVLMKIPWRGPDAKGDLIFIAKPDMAKNRYRTSKRHSHKTSEGPLAELVAPAEPGLYEIRYFSYANGTAPPRGIAKQV